MISAEIPNDEELRLLDLDSYEILDSEPDAEFDELVELAGQICNCPISFISLLDKDRQWFKARKGIVLSETPKYISFCSHAILQDDVMVVEDATNDLRFYDNPLVTGDMKIRFYASAPILSTLGNKLGTICVIDKKPKHITADEIKSLRILSNQITKLLELRKKNLLIRKWAEEIIVIKNKAITKTMSEHEESNKAIAANLHEDLAQSVAACIHQLKIGEDNQHKRLQQILTVEKELELILNSMRQLSYSITPNTMECVAVEDLIQDFTEKINQSFPFQIQFNIIGEKTTVHSEITLFIIRIIEHWLINLSNMKDISLVKLTVKTSDQFEILIEDNGPELSYDKLKEEVFDSLVFEMVRTQNGTVDLCYSSGWNLLQIILPAVET